MFLATRRRWLYLLTSVAISCCLITFEKTLAQQPPSIEGLESIEQIELGGDRQVKQVDAADLREQVMSCIPDNPPGIVEEVELAGQAEVGGTAYYYFYAYDTDIPNNPENAADPTAPNYEGYPSDLVISIAEGECTMEHFNPMNDPIPLAQAIPQQAARLLTLDRYQRTIAQIGRDGLQVRINSWAENPGVNGTTLWDEEQWALEQLGMDIPASLIEG